MSSSSLGKIVFVISACFILISHEEPTLGKGSDEILSGAGELGEVVSYLLSITDLLQFPHFSCMESLSDFGCVPPEWKNFVRHPQRFGVLDGILAVTEDLHLDKVLRNEGRLHDDLLDHD